MEMKDLQTRQNPNWCPGCGDYGIMAALKAALVELQLDMKNVVIVTGIGCGSKINHWVRCYGFEGLHGRPLPVATGVKLANPDLHVIVVGGDGDAYGLGMGHFIHSMRRNINLTYIVQDNQIYGLTTGQTSPTSSRGTRSKSTPFGAIEIPVNPIDLAFGAGATFIARGYAGDLKHLTSLIVQGIKHEGFSLIDTLQPCVSFNKVSTYEFFNKRVYKLEEDKSYKMPFIDESGLFDASIGDAMRRSREWEEKIPIGVFYKGFRPTYESAEIGLLEGKPVGFGEGISIEDLMAGYM